LSALFVVATSVRPSSVSVLAPTNVASAQPRNPPTSTPVPREQASLAYARGWELYRNHDPAAAAVEMERAVSLAPDWAEAQRALGKLLLSLARVCFGTPTLDRERLGRATTALLQAHALEPNHADGAFWAGRALAMGARLAEAERLLLAAARLDPGHGLARKELGLLYAKDGDVERAREELERAAELRPQDDEVVFHLGLQFEADNDSAAALAAYSRALALNPALLGPRSRSISLCQRMGDLAEANRQLGEFDDWREFGERLRKAIDEHEETPRDIHLALAVVEMYLDAGMLDPARSWYARARELEPGDLRTLRRLRRLEQRGQAFARAAEIP
jgi:tetratricopeptide (TPR) repeat protein